MPGAALRTALAGEEPVLKVTVFDAMSAQLAVRAGFGVLSLGGSAVTNTLLGAPDAGFLTLTEMEFLLRRIVTAVPDETSIIVDADDGYGGPLTVMNTVRVLEGLGAAGLMIDDQQAPPRCPNTAAGAPVLPLASAVAKIEAALEARKDDDFFVIARTDAVQSVGLEAAIERANRFAEVGADCVFVAEPLNRKQFELVAKEVTAPHKMGFASGLHGDDPRDPMTLSRMKASGFDLLTQGLHLIRAAALGMTDYLSDLACRGPEANRALDQRLKGTALEDWYEFTGLRRYIEMEERFAPT